MSPSPPNAAAAARLARIALGHVAREYPNVLVHVLHGPDDSRTPRDLHPIFFGSYDWHSCVHGHWLLARLLRLHPQFEAAGEIRAHFDQAFVAAKVAGELAYFDAPGHRGFERPYGWAWLLFLAAELSRPEAPWAAGWARALAPLTQAIAARTADWLERADYPIRTGVHSSTAFALTLAHGYARDAGAEPLARLIEAKAADWYGRDVDCQAWEPSGDDFLSPALMEAELMRRVLPPADFAVWFERFLPRARDGLPATLFEPARVADRSDGKTAHLDGLNLSRAWCWRGLASALQPHDPLVARAHAAAERHLAASLPHVAGDYMGEHWLASFALLALLGPGG